MTLDRAIELAKARATSWKVPHVIIEFMGHRRVCDYDFVSIEGWKNFEPHKPSNARIHSMIQPSIQ